MYNKYNTFDWGAVNVSDDEMPDGQIADWDVSRLQRQHEQKFFLGAGFIRPHIPLYAPQEYFELYPPDKVHKICFTGVPASDLITRAGKKSICNKVLLLGILYISGPFSLMKRSRKIFIE